MKKISSVIAGFILICIGIAALAGQAPLFGIHPAVWFILGVALMVSDSAWERLARAKRKSDGSIEIEENPNENLHSSDSSNRSVKQH